MLESVWCIYPERMAAMVWWLPPIASVAVACVWALSAQYREDRAQRRNRSTRNRYRSAQLRRMGAALGRPLPSAVLGTDKHAGRQPPGSPVTSNRPTRSNCEPLK